MVGNDCWVPKAAGCFDVEGHLVDPEAQRAVQRNLEASLQWTLRLAKRRESDL